MSLCCYCNLCEYPCPTECIYMTPEYEFATPDLTQHLYRFAKQDAVFLTEDPKKKQEADPKPGASPAGADGRMTGEALVFWIFAGLTLGSRSSWCSPAR
jgi:NADH-quinone oxidoreductase subunit I